MQNPEREIRKVIRLITEQSDARDLQAGVEKYFTADAQIIHPMLNSPSQAGKEGVKAAYKMLRVLTLNNKIEFHAVAFDEPSTRKGVEHQIGLIDLTEHLQLRFLPLPNAYNPFFQVRFLVRIDLVKQGDLWYIAKQEDNLPSDYGSSGLPFFKVPVNIFKWFLGSGTFLTASVLNRLNLLN